MRPFKLVHGLAVLAAVAIAVYFWRFTSISLSTGLSEDDLMNLYFAWREPWPDILRANLFHRTPVFRPFGALFYAAGLHAWGLNGFAFRAVCYAVLWLNLPVAYWFARRLTGSREIATLTVLLHCVHACYFPLYYGSGSCYDVFAFFFYFSAFALALRIRQSARFGSVLECFALAVLFACAVNSKEAAASLPALLLAYELLTTRPRSFRWIWQQGRPVLITGLVGLVFLWARFTGPSNLLSHPSYAPVFTAERYLQSTALYLNELSCTQNFWSPERSAMLLGSMGVLAIAARSRTLTLAWLLVVLGAAPIAFVTPRGLSAYYLPLLGYALHLAFLLARARERLVRSAPGPVVLASKAAVFAVVFLGLWRWNAANVRQFPVHWRELTAVEETIAQFNGRPDWFRSRSSLLIASDAFEHYEWASVFLASMVGNERTLIVHKLSKLETKPSAEDIARYTTVIEYKDGRYREADRSAIR